MQDTALTGAFAQPPVEAAQGFRAALNAMLADGSIPRRSTSDDAAHRAILEELDEVAAGNGIAARN